MKIQFTNKYVCVRVCMDQVARINTDRPVEEIYKEVKRLVQEV